MRNTIFAFIGTALLVSFAACDDWTSPEKLDVENEAVGALCYVRDGHLHSVFLLLFPCSFCFLNNDFR